MHHHATTHRQLPTAPRRRRPLLSVHILSNHLEIAYKDVRAKLAAAQRTPFSPVHFSKATKLRSALGAPVLDNGWEMVEVKGAQ